MAAVTTLHTDRLTLRPWRDDDLDALAAVYADPEVMRYIMDGAVRDRDETAEALRRIRRSWDERGFGLFAVEVRATGALAGWAGLAVPDFLPEVLPAVEIGWRFARGRWGHGYATEAAAAALRFGFADPRYESGLGLDRVVSIRHVDNTRSARVMAKLGIAYGFSTVVPQNGQPVAVHALTRQQYAGARPTTAPGR